MTKMATMAINRKKKPLKIFFSRTSGQISTKLGMWHRGRGLIIVYINHDPRMTLTYFMARSTKVANAFEWEKMVKCYLMGKTYWEWANGQKINVNGKL